MIDKFNQIIKENIHPVLKSNGFSKKGLNFYKSNDKIQQIINFQKSQGNSSDDFTFYINCGILINDLVENKRELKSIWDSDIQKRIADISPIIVEDGIKINRKTDVTKLNERLFESFTENVIPYFDKNRTTELCILEMVNNNGLHKNKELLNFLCENKDYSLIKDYINNVKKMLMKSDGVERTEKFMLRFYELLKSNNYLTIEIEDVLKTTGNKGNRCTTP